MNISLPKNELQRLRSLYEQELVKTLERLSHIESVLGQLNESDGKATKTTAVKSTGRKSTTKKRKTGKKRGPRSVWGNFVMKKLADLGKPLTYNELTNEALTFANVGPEKEKNIRQSIINTTFKLRNTDKKIDTFSLGNRIKYVALKEWFDENGKIKSAFASKASKAVPKNQVKKKPKARVKKKAKAVKRTPKPAKQTAKPVKQTAKPVKQTAKAANQTAKPTKRRGRPAKQQAKAVKSAAKPVKQTAKAVKQTPKPVKKQTKAAEKAAEKA